MVRFLRSNNLTGGWKGGAGRAGDNKNTPLDENPMISDTSQKSQNYEFTSVSKIWKYCNDLKVTFRILACKFYWLAPSALAIGKVFSPPTHTHIQKKLVVWGRGTIQKNPLPREAVCGCGCGGGIPHPARRSMGDLNSFFLRTWIARFQAIWCYS